MGAVCGCAHPAPGSLPRSIAESLGQELEYGQGDSDELCQKSQEAQDITGSPQTLRHHHISIVVGLSAA